VLVRAGRMLRLQARLDAHAFDTRRTLLLVDMAGDTPPDMLAIRRAGLKYICLNPETGGQESRLRRWALLLFSIWKPGRVVEI